MKQVVVSTGSRLHFGLVQVGQPVAGDVDSSRPSDVASYGGIGTMVDYPRTEIVMRLDESASSTGGSDAKPDQAKRGDAFAQAWLAHLDCTETPVSIQTAMLPESHAGLGSGTQLAQAVALGINCLLGRERPDPLEVAAVLDRGQRSLIGSAGFHYGGMIVDRPPGVDSTCRQTLLSIDDGVAKRIAVPESWRVVLIYCKATRRVFGEREKALFAELAAKPGEYVTQLQSLINGDIIPAVRDSDFARFGEAVYQYGNLSGQYYREFQGGPYNGPEISAVVAGLRDRGVQGVGQTSWGPVVFAWADSLRNATAIKQSVTALAAVRKVEIVAPRNAGASIQTVENRGVATPAEAGYEDR